jgi:Patatin-like phospholipase
MTRNALPEQYSGKVKIAGMPQIRDYYAGGYSDYYQKDFEDSVRQHIKSMPEGYALKILAISGGGANGAFGVGLINGWDASGTRPVFTIVTGISTGAFIAPFAFLGGKYDAEIGRLFTSVNTDDIYKKKSFFSILGSLLGSSDSLADSKPLADLLVQYIDGELLNDIAKAHSKGRRLLIATTNLDARKLVVWNMGAIASSGHPKAHELFRSVVLASASMPVAFPAVYIDVEAGGQTYDEMHVDGGLITEVFFCADMFNIQEGLKNVGIKNKPEVKLYIIRNNQVDVRYEEVDVNILSIAGRSLSSLTTAQGVGDLYRIYLLSKREGIDYNLASIPADFEPNAQEAFDPVEMKRLYDLGYNMAVSGYPWEKLPPKYEE